MARQSLGQSKKVTPENLRTLGAERLAEILADVAGTRVDLKRRLRMELAAQHGPGALIAEIDKRLGAFETSRGQITWRQRPAFIRDLDALRDLIATRLCPLDPSAGVERLWRFIASAPQSRRRYRERNDELDALFIRAAVDLGRALQKAPPGPSAETLVQALLADPVGWTAWLPALLAEAPRLLAVDALASMIERAVSTPGWMTLVRHVADAAQNPDAYRATYGAAALRTPSVAAELGKRYLAAGRIEDAGEVLRAAAPSKGVRGSTPVVDMDWETVWIDYLDRAGRGPEAQAVRWASFERTLEPDRARSFIRRLPDFEDVEAESRAFGIAAHCRDFEKGLGFLMAWPALPVAAQMITDRPGEAALDPDKAELWAAKLRRRFPEAARVLLRATAAAAFRRRDFKTGDRLSAEAESLEV